MSRLEAGCLELSESPRSASAVDAPSCAEESVRLQRRLLLMTAVVPPVPIADAFVIKGLLSELQNEEVVVASERWPENPPDQITAAFEHHVHFVGRTWTWPKRGRRFVWWMKWFTVPTLAYRLIRLAKREKCGAVLANFPDEMCLCAAVMAARRLGLKLFVFFHNTYRENRRGVDRVMANWLQRKVFERAEVVFVMSDGMKEAWEALYPGVNFQPLLHTFDGPVTHFEALPPIDRARVRLAYMGSINQANLDAIKRVGEVVKASHDLELNIYSSAPGWQLQNEGLTGDRIRKSQPSDDELHQALRTNDILILPHGLTGGLAAIEYQTIFPTRTIPYLLSGRPILAHSARGSFLSRWLRQHDCADLVEDPDPAALRAAIHRLCGDAARREQLVRNALRAAEQFRARRVVNDMKRLINQYLDEPSGTSQQAP